MQFNIFIAADKSLWLTPRLLEQHIIVQRGQQKESENLTSLSSGKQNTAENKFII